jgi:hypothetical protein
MKKIILLLLLFTSCASRKVNVETTEIKKDSTVENKSIVKTLEIKQKTDSTNITINADSSEIVITPIDSSKTIIVDGKTYRNIVLRIKKNKTNTSYRNNKSESNIKHIDSITTTKTSIKESVVNKTKNIEKETNYWILLYWLILILILYLLWQNKQRLFNVL